MATDATGTATSPDSIPTYNTSVDAPSGNGFNAAMASIQTALTGRILKSLMTAVGDLLYASGVSTPARLGIGTTGQVLTVAGGLPTWAAAAATLGFATTLPTATDGVETVLTDSVSAPTYMWRLRYVSAATKWFPQAGSWGYGTSLPTVPALVDKVEFTLVDSVTVPTYQWTFRYNAGSSNTDKWEFVGGAPALAEVTTLEGTTSATYAALGTAGPSITVPRAGVYDVTVSMACLQADTNTGAMSYDIGGTAAVDADACYSAESATASQSTRTRRKTGVAASTAFVSKYRRVGGGGTCDFGQRLLTIVPVRVS